MQEGILGFVAGAAAAIHNAAQVVEAARSGGLLLSRNQPVVLAVPHV